MDLESQISKNTIVYLVNLFANFFQSFALCQQYFLFMISKSNLIYRDFKSIMLTIHLLHNFKQKSCFKHYIEP